MKRKPAVGLVGDNGEASIGAQLRLTAKLNGRREARGLAKARDGQLWGRDFVPAGEDDSCHVAEGAVIAAPTGCIRQKR
jgi:hypothetical protein